MIIEDWDFLQLQCALYINSELSGIPLSMQVCSTFLLLKIDTDKLNSMSETAQKVYARFLPTTQRKAGSFPR